MNIEEYLEVYRHSLSHILAKAMIEIFGRENVQYAIGPQIADGFSPTTLRRSRTR